MRHFKAIGNSGIPFLEIGRIYKGNYKFSNWANIKTLAFFSPELLKEVEKPLKQKLNGTDMKVEINEKEKTKEREFPKLMICKGEKTKGLVVFFESECSGQSLNKVGVYYSGYTSIHWDMDQFQDFDGSITLSND